MILDQNKLPKMNTRPATLEKLQNIMEQYPNHSYIFNDRSKDNDKITNPALLKKIVKRGLQNLISKNKSKNFITFTDSLSYYP